MYVVTYYHNGLKKEYDTVFQTEVEAENFIEECLEDDPVISGIEIHTKEEFEQYEKVRELEKSIDI